VTLAEGRLSGGKPAWPLEYAVDAGHIEVPARDVLILPIA
jgi:beta-galactosidase